MIRILPNGGTMYMPAKKPERPQPKRGNTSGWSRNVSRRNADFLLSVLAPQLTGHGLALSLTLKDCPPSADHWHRVRLAFVHRLRRLGMIRLHWLTEWQRRGVPHLHAAVWFESPIPPHVVQYHWLAAAAEYRPGPYAQHIAPITGAPGWFEYLAKHATRGVQHYQRSPDLIPTGWKTKTGRMWGHLGAWPTAEAQEIDPPLSVWHQFRRLMIRYQIGKARRQRDTSRLRYLRAYRCRAPRDTSAVQALPRLWIPSDDQWALLACAHGSHEV